MASVVSTIAVDLKLDDRQFTAGLRRASRNMQSFAGKGKRSADMTGTFNANSARLFHFSRLFGNSMGLMSVATHPVALGLIEVGQHLKNMAQDVIQTGARWESAFTSVAKTVNATDSELAVLEQSLRRMASFGPASISVGLEDAHFQLAKIAQVAGTLGLMADEVAPFTEQIAILTQNADDLTAENAARSLAQFGQITGFNFDQTSNLVAAITELGNSFPTTEGKIVNFAQRLAGAGAQIGLTEADILGLSTALASFGFRPELAGTNFTKFITKILESFSGFEGTIDSASETLVGFAAISGMTVEQFAESWETDAIGAITAFAQGLSQLNAQEQVETLENLGLTGLRLGDVMRRIANNPELLANAIESSNQAFEENNAHIEEASRRLNTLDAQWNRFNNTLTEFKILGHESIFEGIAKDALGTINMLADLGHIFVDPDIIDTQQVEEAEQALTGLAGMMQSAGKELAVTDPKSGLENTISRLDNAAALAENFGGLETPFSETPEGAIELAKAFREINDMGELTALEQAAMLSQGDYSGFVAAADAMGKMDEDAPSEESIGRIRVLTETVAALGMEIGLFEDRQTGREMFLGPLNSASQLSQQLVRLVQLIPPLNTAFNIMGGALGNMFDFEIDIGDLLVISNPATAIADLIGESFGESIADNIDIPVNLKLPDDPTQIFDLDEYGGEISLPIDFKLADTWVADLIGLSWSQWQPEGILPGLPIQFLPLEDWAETLKADAIEAWNNLEVGFTIGLKLAEDAIADILSSIRAGLPDELEGLIGLAEAAIPGNAAGGPVMGGRPYMVGEKGPELFVPRASGEIIPNHRLGGGGASPITIANLTVTGVQDLRGLVGEIERIQKSRRH